MSTPFDYKHLSDSAFEFTTEKGVKYRATFANAAQYFPSNTDFSSMVPTFYFELLFNPFPQIPDDPRVGTTISFFILQFFEQNPEGILFFIHDGSDGRERGRRKTFDAWLQKAGSTSFLKKDAEIPVGRFKILASLLLLMSHPLLDKVLDGFEQLVLEATTKPEDSD